MLWKTTANGISCAVPDAWLELKSDVALLPGDVALPGDQLDPNHLSSLVEIEIPRLFSSQSFYPPAI